MQESAAPIVEREKEFLQTIPAIGHEELAEKEKLKASLVLYFDAERTLLNVYVFAPEESLRISMSKESGQTHRSKKGRVYSPNSNWNCCPGTCANSTKLKIHHARCKQFHDLFVSAWIKNIYRKIFITEYANP